MKKYSKNGYKKGSVDQHEPWLEINSRDITMKNVEHPVVGIDNLGNTKLMMPGTRYTFPGNSVFEVPLKDNKFSNKQAQKGKESKYTKKEVDEFNKLHEGYALGETAYNMFLNKKDTTRPPAGKKEKIISSILPFKNCWYNNACVQTVKDIFNNAGVDSGIPDDVYDNVTFLKNYKDYGFELIDNASEEDMRMGDIIQFTEYIEDKDGRNEYPYHMGMYIADDQYISDGEHDEPIQKKSVSGKGEYKVFRKLQRGGGAGGNELQQMFGPVYDYFRSKDNQKEFIKDATVDSDVAKTAEFFPIAGEILDTRSALSHARKGEWGDAAMYGAAAFIPFVPGRVVKKVMKNYVKPGKQLKKFKDWWKGPSEETAQMLSPEDMNYARNLGITDLDGTRNNLVGLYGKHNNRYRAFDADPNILSSPKFLKAATDAGVDINDPTALKKFMGSSIPLRSLTTANRATSGLLTEAPNRDFMFSTTKPHKQWALDSYAKRYPNLAKFPAYQDDIKDLTDIQMINRIKYKDALHATDLQKNPNLAKDLKSSYLVKSPKGMNKAGVDISDRTTHMIGEPGKQMIDPDKVEILDVKKNPELLEDFQRGAEILQDAQVKRDLKDDTPYNPTPPTLEDIGHGVLDVASMFDPTPTVDSAHAAWYAAKGDAKNAALYTGMAALPAFVGAGALGAKYLSKGAKAIKKNLSYNDIMKLPDSEFDKISDVGKDYWNVVTKKNPKYKERLVKTYNEMWTPSDEFVGLVEKGRKEVIDFYKTPEYKERLIKGMRISSKEADEIIDDLVKETTNTKTYFTNNKLQGTAAASPSMSGIAMAATGPKNSRTFFSEELTKMTPEQILGVVRHEFGHASVYGFSRGPAGKLMKNFNTPKIKESVRKTWKENNAQHLIEYYGNADEIRQRALNTLQWLRKNNMSVDDFMKMDYMTVTTKSQRGKIPGDAQELRQYFNDIDVKDYLNKAFSITAPITVGTKALSEKQEGGDVDFKELEEKKQNPGWVANRLRKTVNPIGYNMKNAVKGFVKGKRQPFMWDGTEQTFDTFGDNLDMSKNQAQHIKSSSMDAWLKYLGFPQENETFVQSDFKPTIRKEDKKGTQNYWSFSNDDDIWDAASQYLDSEESVLIKDSDAGGYTMKDFTVENKYDPNTKLDYISYYDEFDFDIPTALGNVKGENIAGQPYDIYGRMYYDKKYKDKDGNPRRIPNKVVDRYSIRLNDMKAGIQRVESLDGQLMKNPQSSATGRYGQLFNQIRKQYKGNRNSFAKDGDAQNKFFEKKFNGSLFKNEKGMQQTGYELYWEYQEVADKHGYSPVDIAALSNMLGRKGTREYLGYHLRDGKPLEEALPRIYGKRKKQQNKTPDEYIKIFREGVNDYRKIQTENLNSVLESLSLDMEKNPEFKEIFMKKFDIPLEEKGGEVLKVDKKNNRLRQQLLEYRKGNKISKVAMDELMSMGLI